MRPHGSHWDSIPYPLWQWSIEPDNDNSTQRINQEWRRDGPDQRARLRSRIARRTHRTPKPSIVHMAFFLPECASSDDLVRIVSVSMRNQIHVSTRLTLSQTLTSRTRHVRCHNQSRRRRPRLALASKPINLPELRMQFPMHSDRRPSH
jgi:hypothetical protein